jgi:hypothetical protein
LIISLSPCLEPGLFNPSTFGISCWPCNFDDRSMHLSVFCFASVSRHGIRSVPHRDHSWLLTSTNWSPSALAAWDTVENVMTGSRVLPGRVKCNETNCDVWDKPRWPIAGKIEGF